jgi:hypothetical protein
LFCRCTMPPQSLLKVQTRKFTNLSNQCSSFVCHYAIVSLVKHCQLYRRYETWYIFCTFPFASLPTYVLKLQCNIHITTAPHSFSSWYWKLHMCGADRTLMLLVALK